MQFTRSEYEKLRKLGMSEKEIIALEDKQTPSVVCPSCGNRVKIKLENDPNTLYGERKTAKCKCGWTKFKSPGLAWGEYV